MPEVILNGHHQWFLPGTTILAAAQHLGVEIPTLCHDPRLKPTGACRLCVVEVRGWDRHPSACNTPLMEGMEIITHSPDVESVRRTALHLWAEGYPADALQAWPDKPFHRWLRHYGIRWDLGSAHPADPVTEPDGSGPAFTHRPFRDATHPYLHADFSRCITCFRCQRICDEVQGQFVWKAWNRGDHTGFYPGEAVSLLASSCVSCGACADTCPTGALEDQSVLKSGLPTQWTRSVCPYCGVGCEFQVGVRAGRILQIKPAMDAPVNRGHLCAKGRYAFGYVHAEDRVTEPMIRRSGGWQTVSWAEAIEAVAQGFQSIRNRMGSDALGVLGSARATLEENYLAQKFARVVLGTHNIDCCARVCHAPSAAALKQTLGQGAATNSFDDIERASTFLLCGCNPTENHPVLGARIRQAVLHGARLIVIDPRKTELVPLAQVHLQLRPGTNIPVLLSMAHVLIRDDAFDESRVREQLEGWDDYRTHLEAWPPERAARIAGVEADDIRKAALLYARNSPSMSFHGLGLTEHHQGTDGVRCLIHLALLTGNYGRPGSGVNPLRGQNNVQGAAHMGCDPAMLTGAVSLDQGKEIFESVWGRPLPESPGLNLPQMLDAAQEGRLGGLWVQGYDIALTHPNSGRTRSALASLECVVVQDLFLNEVAREFGHVFLPACSSFEKDGTFMNAERRVQRVRRCLDPVGKSRPDWEIICRVAQAMGCLEAFDFQSPHAVWEEIRSVWKAGAGITYARLDRSGLQWPCWDEDDPGTSILYQGYHAPGLRPHLTVVDYIPTPETTLADYPFLLTTGRTLQGFNAGTMTGRTPSRQLRPHDTLDMHPADAQRLGLCEGQPVRLTSRHGQATLPLRIDSRVRLGELFASFQSPEVLLNCLTSSWEDPVTQTPEYKVVAVRVDPA